MPLFCLYFSISTVCKWTLHVPVEMYPLQLTLLFLTVCAHNLTPKLNTLCAPALRHYAHTHAHTYKQPCNDTDSSPAGRCQTPGRSKPRTSPSRCFYFILFIFSWADGMSEASSGSGSPQSITSLVNRRSWERHLVTSVCASWWKIASEGTHVWFLWFDKFNFAKKKREHK